MELPMAERIGLVYARRMGWWAWLPLALYVLLRGLDATALKWLQLQGAAQGLNGVNPISFCNVFFVAQLIVGLATLAPGRKRLARDLGSLAGRDRLLLALHGGLGLFLGPVATFLALDALSVISQTLLFALVLPLSALLAHWLLQESLPRAFWPSLALVLTGLLLPQATMAMAGGPMDQLGGVAWALVGVGAFAGSAITGRLVAARRWPLAISVGLPSTLAALVFAVIALVLYGPEHFLLLRLWWVVGVIGGYGLCLSLGRELALRAAYRQFPVAKVSLWGSLTIVVAALSATWLLGEPLAWPTALGLVLVMAGVVLAGAARARRDHPDQFLDPDPSLDPDRSHQSNQLVHLDQSDQTARRYTP